MTQTEIDALSETDFNRIYLERLYKLREDIKNIKARLKKKNKTLTKNQELISDMISTSKNSATITENNVTIKLSTGCKQHGLKHILLRHFCDDCEGKVSAIDIISLERFFKQINSYNGKNGKTGYIYKKDESNKYLLLVFKDINSDGVISVFKMDRIENVVEIGEGAISPEENFGNLSGELRKTK